MARMMGRMLVVGLLIVAGSVALWRYERIHSEQWQHEQDIKRIEQLEQEKRTLEEQKRQKEAVIARLATERRVAELLVTDQGRAADGSVRTTLMFVEYGRDGQPLPPRQFTIAGSGAHIDAMVIKFERDFLYQNDPLRGHSIVLFHRLFGDHQTPADAFAIDAPGSAPGVYGGSNGPAGRDFETSLWRDFWRLADDEAYRREKGVRVANPESVWRNFNPDQIYTVTLESAGGLNLTSRPLDPVWRQYRDSLRSHDLASTGDK